ncbi:MAG: hypothetical protein NVSMB45_15760 [Ginsengibacter sp.]
MSFTNIKIHDIKWNSDPDKTPKSNNNALPFIVHGQGAETANKIFNLKVEDCEFYNNITGFSEVLPLDGNIENFLIANNKVYNNTNIGIALIGHYGTSNNASLDQARKGVVSHNICNNNVSKYATSGGIYVDGGADIKIERNESYILLRHLCYCLIVVVLMVAI